MTDSLRTLTNQAKDIYQEEGLSDTIKRVLASVISVIASGDSFYYVYERTLKKSKEADYLPKIQNVTHRMVETTQQLDELSSEGFDLSLIDINQSRYRLEKGAIASLIFIDGEFASTSWSAFTEEAKNTFNRHPYKVDFANNEVCGGGTWVNPKHRRQGLAYYSSYKEEQFLIGKGAIKNRSIVLKDNIASIGWSAKLGAKIVATAHYIRIFGLQFWRERPVKLDNDQNN